MPIRDPLANLTSNPNPESRHINRYDWSGGCIVLILSSASAAQRPLYMAGRYRVIRSATVH